MADINYIYQLIDKAFHTKRENAYWETIFALRKCENENAIGIYFSLILSNDIKYKLIGIDTLSQYGKDRTKFRKRLLKKIFEILQTTDNEKLIVRCLIAISHNNKDLTEKHILFLEQFKYSKSKDVRYALVFSLLTIEREEAIEILIFLSYDRSPVIRDWAVFGIGTQIKTDNEIIRDFLYKKTFDKDEYTKQEAIKGLAFRDDERVNSIIEKELDSENCNSVLFDTILSIKNGNCFLPKLKKLYKNSLKNKSIKQEWISELRNSIKILEEN